MASLRKILDTVLSGRSDANLRFNDLCRLLENLGFSKRINGSHHIHFRQGIVEIINIQALPGGKAKPYQVRQIRQIIVEYRLAIPERPA
ncbi:MAG: type II toxin-antitoxin system HicA family toxin [Tepidisphaeraceae bacterium]|jgi:predicted RNA binding protein YcfA (HicA-like mRNA interferase family)